LFSQLKSINIRKTIIVLVFIILLSSPYLFNYWLFLLWSWDLNTAINSNWYWTHKEASIINVLTWHWAWSFNEKYFSFFKVYDTIIYRWFFLIIVILSLFIVLFKKYYSLLRIVLFALFFLWTWIYAPFW
jgi:hypothetical protein